MSEYLSEISDLIPENFSLENYKKAKTLNSLHWYSNILERVSIERFLNGSFDKSDEYYDLDNMKKSNNTNLINGFSDKDISGWFGDIEDVNKLLIRSMALRDHQYLSKDIQYKKVNEKYYETEVDSFSSYGLMGTAMVSVNLNAPDEMLIESFKKWLSGARRNVNYTPKQKRLTSSVLRRWFNNKAIEFLDLSQWYRLRNKTLYDHQAASVLFPDEIKRNTTDVVTKTIRKKLIPEMLAEQTQAALLFQGIEADIEADSKKNSSKSFR